MALRAPDETRQRPIYYAPNTEYTELLMNASFGDRDLQGFLKEEELLDKCESTGVDLCVYFSQSGRGGDGSPSLAYKLHFFESEPPLKDAFGVDFRYPKEFYYEQEYEKPQFGERRKPSVLPFKPSVRSTGPTLTYETIAAKMQISPQGAFRCLGSRRTSNTTVLASSGSWLSASCIRLSSRYAGFAVKGRAV
ncbi:hypothetical protein V5799_030424 [Amblyomma americanum]|uniref:Uncharacterized protein n=1 Tax=Amblyomma americanum TaxID=6943 RepID=A0AAQ4ENF0_AMBAM